MNDKLEPKKTGGNWFRWLPRFLLIVVAIVPVCYYDFYQYMIVEKLEFKYYPPDEIILSSLLLVIAIIAWFLPIIGGLLAVIAAPIELLWAALLVSAMGTSDGFPSPILIECVLLFLGGILSIIWGAMKRKRSKRERI
jgi:hypothetical protein